MSRPLEHLTVIVVGAGVGGTAAALLLAGAGARVTLLERVPEPRAVGAGILLQPNGLAVLYGLGLGPTISRHGFSSKVGAFVDARGRLLFGGPIPVFGRGLDHVLCIRRSHLLAALANAVQAHERIEARFGAEVIDGGRGGTATYVAGDAGKGSRTVRGDVIVAADGVHSRLRSAAGFAARERHSGMTYVRTISRAPCPTIGIQEAWTPLGIFGWGPVDGGTYVYTSARAPALAAALSGRDLVAFREAWLRAYPPGGAVLAGVERFEDLLLNEVLRVDCGRFVEDRLALLGDAAHAMAPNLGQGANSALVDAAVLAHELCATPADVPAALVRYDARRRPAVQAIQDLSQRLGALADQRSAVLRLLRDGALRVLGPLLARGGGGIRAAQQEDPAWLLDAASAATAGEPAPARVS